jgi:hypothetical protein
MSPSDQSNMMEYTHSLKAALNTTQEHAAFLTTAQTNSFKNWNVSNKNSSRKGQNS